MRLGAQMKSSRPPRLLIWCDLNVRPLPICDKPLTIFLKCNNPMTKEPKLDRARRILPEWEGLDQEARALMDKFKKEKAQNEEDSVKKQTSTSKDEL